MVSYNITAHPARRAKSSPRRASQDSNPNIPTTAPANFNAAKYPIIGQHFFGLSPVEVAADVVADLRFHQMAEADSEGGAALWEAFFPGRKPAKCRPQGG